MVFTGYVASALAFASTALALPQGTATGTAFVPNPTLGWAQHWLKTAQGQYLQAKVPFTPGAAVVGDASTAGEFNVVSGELVDTVHTPTFLYASVAPMTSGASKLAVTFANGDDAPASAGTFSWVGSGTDRPLTWSRSDTPAVTGWLSCDGALFVNLATATPAGCSAVTLTGATTTFAG